ncbi:hypothetical protein MNBD_IGNAVI01-1562 [hydrothermal vent metagenome]|uniref:Sensor of ECF-type sigma factor n=1 Tax=hydrothermal vent metagenome TaxID=652676 RepID=A0A3B1BX60_9ZZZZ
MKKIIIGLVVLMSASLFAQSTDTYLELLRSDIKAQKKAVIAEAMNLNDLQSEKFWPIYREFEFEWDKLADVRVGIIKEYAAHFDTLTDEKADELVQKSYELDEDKLDLEKEYYKKVKEQLGAKQAGKFMQLITRLNMLIDIQIAAELPLIPVDSTDTSSGNK